MSVKPEVELIFTIALIKYLENGYIYDVGLTGDQIGNRLWAYD